MFEIIYKMFIVLLTSMYHLKCEYKFDGREYNSNQK